MSIRVVIVDDQPLVRAGLEMFVRAQPDIELVAEAADGEEAVRVVAEHRPDVVLMDVRMPGVDGIEATRRITADPGNAATRIVMLTTFDRDAYVVDAFRAGASGFLLKDLPPEQLIAGLRLVAGGEALLAGQITRRLVEAHSATTAPLPEPPGLDQLTAREREILLMLGRGRSNAEIARDLILGEKTVKTHVSRVFMKLGLRDRVQAVVFAYEHGLVAPGEAGATGTAAG